MQVFSKKSRYRLIKMMHGLEYQRVAFLTLTYGRTWPQQRKIYKGHLKAFRRAFERRYGPLRMVWRLEFQKRGAPHYHLMILDPPFLPVQELNTLWDDVTGRPQEQRHGNSVDLKLSVDRKEQRLISSYLAKYISKIDEREIDPQDENTPGRFWGRWNIEDPQPFEVELSASEAYELVETLLAERGADGWVPDDLTRCTIFGNSMGTSDFQAHVMYLIDGIRAKRRPVKQKK